ncbi:hypothetical protein ACKLNO_10790 [Neisseriaceae bacterium B1]
MITTTILLLLLVFLLSMLLIIRRLLAKQEHKLGYPKAEETFEDVKLLMLLQQDIFALRCYRRVYPKASFAEAKYMINKLRQQFNQLQEQVHEQVQEKAQQVVAKKADAKN